VGQSALEERGIGEAAAQALLQPAGSGNHGTRGAAQRAATSTVLSNSTRNETFPASGTMSS
jgi:hypothetical protein